jgi:hypothetical protein
VEPEADHQKRGQDDWDPLFLIRPLYEVFRKALRKCSEPRRHLAVDEFMIACKLKTFLQTMVKGKPTPNGIKGFAICGENGQLIDIILDDGMSFARRPWALNGEAVVLEFVYRNDIKSLTVIYMDKWFTSVKLARLLAAKHRIMTCGPIRANRKSFPVPTKEEMKMNEPVVAAGGKPLPSVTVKMSEPRGTT